MHRFCDPTVCSLGFPAGIFNAEIAHCSIDVVLPPPSLPGRLSWLELLFLISKQILRVSLSSEQVVVLKIRFVR